VHAWFITATSRLSRLARPAAATSDGVREIAETARFWGWRGVANRHKAPTPIVRLKLGSFGCGEPRTEEATVVLGKSALHFINFDFCAVSHGEVPGKAGSSQSVAAGPQPCASLHFWTAPATRLHSSSLSSVNLPATYMQTRFEAAARGPQTLTSAFYSHP